MVSLAYPCGVAPGFDPSHPAAQGAPIGFSAVALGKSFLNLMTGIQPAASPLAESFTLDGAIGPSVVTVGDTSSGENRFWQCNIPRPPATLTLAAIIRPTNISTANRVIALVGQTSVTNNFSGLAHTSTGSLILLATGSTFTPSPTITLTAGHAYFCAVSAFCDGVNVTANLIATDLQTGVTQSGAASGTLSQIDNHLGFAGLGCGWTEGAIVGNTAAGMCSLAYLSLAQLNKWASNPWGYWYPQSDDSWVGSAIASIALAARTAAMSASRIAAKVAMPMLASSKAQASGKLSGIYKMAFAAKAAATVTARVSSTTGILFQAIASTKAMSRATGSYKALLSGLATTQAKASASGIYKMAFSATAAAASHFKGLLSNGAQLAGSGASAAQAKLKAGMSLSAALAGKAAAQTKSTSAGIYNMAFSSKSATQAKTSGSFRLMLLMVATSASQAKAKTGNTLRVLMSATASAASHVRGVYTRSGISPSRFFAYFIS